jgi:hypothetical protein
MLSNQGFEKDLNLSETVDDAQILNNLAGGSIASDIALFRNNLRNTSSLIWQYNTDNSSIVNNNGVDEFLFPDSLSFVFTDGDEVKLKGNVLGTVVLVPDALNSPTYKVDSVTLSGVMSGYTSGTISFTAPATAGGVTAEGTITFSGSVPTVVITTSGSGYTSAPTASVTFLGNIGSLNTSTTYYIVGLKVGLGEFKNQKSFSLSLTKPVPGITPTTVSVGTITNNVEFIRKDAVTQENILNIIRTSDPDQNGAFSFDYIIGGTSFSNSFDTIENNINTTNFDITRKYVTNKSIATESIINVEGLITVKDPANSNISAAALTAAKSPGVYITNPFSSVTNIAKTRAFSSSSQPWEPSIDTETPSANPPKIGKLTTKSTQVNIGDLFFENGIKLDGFDGEATVSPVGTVNTGISTQFTHKLPVKINGVEYFVLVRRV